METFYGCHAVTLNLSYDDILMHQISFKNRNMIRKAEKDGIIKVESDDYDTFL